MEFGRLRRYWDETTQPWPGDDGQKDAPARVPGVDGDGRAVERVGGAGATLPALGRARSPAVWRGDDAADPLHAAMVQPVGSRDGRSAA